ncbi:MAG: hypothetical protein B7Y39_02720 [Bdellovibrio sp. 28-41-41]|nr:MAG: hypothetical protein B7Y39_02720 [Bdellovibrio sp. 28-41-41]
MNMKCIALLLVSWTTTFGAALYEYNRPVRALGMGGVYLNFVKDADAPTINPAALGFVSGIAVEVANIGLGINGLDTISTYSASGSVNNVSDYDRFFGKKIRLGANGRVSAIMPNFGLSVYDDAQVSLILRNTAFPNIDMSFFNDYGFVVAGAFPVAPLTSLGVALKRINRWGGYQTVGLSTIAAGNSAALQNEFENKGVGYGGDLALMTKIPGRFSPSFSIVWQDVGSTAFTKTTGNDAPPRIKDNLQAGVGLVLDLPGIDLSGGFEYRHINDTGVQIGKKLHTGFELSLPLIDLRIGSSQGYSTMGAGFSFLFLNFDAAMFKTEAGEYPGQTPEDQILLSLSIDLSVDANFNFYSKEGKKRNLKQRR